MKSNSLPEVCFAEYPVGLLSFLISTRSLVLRLLFSPFDLRNAFWRTDQRYGRGRAILTRLMRIGFSGFCKNTVFGKRRSLTGIAFTANLSSFFAASEITAPWVLFKASSSVASLLSLSLSTSNGLEKGPFFFSHLGCLGVSFSASEGPKVGLRSGIGMTLSSQPLKEEGSLSLIQWMLESEVSRSGSSRALSF